MGISEAMMSIGEYALIGAVVIGALLLTWYIPLFKPWVGFRKPRWW